MLVLGGRAHLDNITAAIADSRAKQASEAEAAQRAAKAAPGEEAAKASDSESDPTSIASNDAEGAGGASASATPPEPPAAPPVEPPADPSATTEAAATTAAEATPASAPAPVPPTFEATPVAVFHPPVWWKGARTGVRGMVSPRVVVAAAEEGGASGGSGGGSTAAAGPGFKSLAYTPRVEALALLGELLHILRPLVAALTMKAQGGRGGWAPVLLSAAMDAASWQLSEYAATEGGAADTRPAAPSFLDAITGRGAFKHITLRSSGGAPGGGAAAGEGSKDGSSIGKAFDSGLAALALRLVWWASSAAVGPAPGAGTGRCLTPEEEDELSRRKRMWALYLLRSPVFQRATLPAANSVAAAAGYVPLMGWVVQFAVGMLGYYNRVHFYNSAST